MKLKLLFLLMTVAYLPGCMKVMNSSSGDYILNNASIEFLNVYTIMKDKCFSCHQEFNTTQDTLIANGWVVRGNALNSPLYYRLQGSMGSGVKNMPQSGSLTADDRETIKNWINSL